MRLLVMMCLVAGLPACSGSTDTPADNGAGASAEKTVTDTDTSHIAVVIRHGEQKPDTRLSVELALTPEQQEQGLQHRTDLKQGQGMLFPMVPPRTPSFWMKDTPMSLDLVFIRTDGSVGKIVANAKPNDETPLFPDMPVSGVLELAGGSAAALGIDASDRVNWGACAGEAGPSPVAEAENFCPAR